MLAAGDAPWLPFLMSTVSHPGDTGRSPMAVPADSIVRFIRELVRIPTRAGIDEYGPLIGTMTRWFDAHGVPYRILSEDGQEVGLVVRIGAAAGPTYLLNATIDTANFGDEGAWTAPPTSALIRDGWLYGRGAADSKAGVAIFCHVAAALVPRAAAMRGRLEILFDADEHTGTFGGIKAYLAGGGRPAGAMLGYPGMEGIGAGSRGFQRAVLTVHGVAAHSGSSSNAGVNAVVRAAELVGRLSSAELPMAGSFPLPPKLTVTYMEGGAGFSGVPDLCHVGVDMRVTPSWNLAAARRHLEGAVRRLDASGPDLAETAIEWLEGWPAYRLDPGSVVLEALAASAREAVGAAVPAVVVGPSNIGNLLAASGIEATCGFGVRYRNLHAADEAIDLATIAPVYRTYLRTVERLLLEG